MTLKSEIEAIIWGQTFAASVGARLSVEDAADRADKGIEQFRLRLPQPDAGRYDGPGIVVSNDVVADMHVDLVEGPVVEEPCRTS